jgi:hypothetical protein
MIGEGWATISGDQRGELHLMVESLPYRAATACGKSPIQTWVRAVPVGATLPSRCCLDCELALVLAESTPPEAS